MATHATFNVVCTEENDWKVIAAYWTKASWGRAHHNWGMSPPWQQCAPTMQSIQVLAIRTRDISGQQMPEHAR